MRSHKKYRAYLWTCALLVLTCSGSAFAQPVSDTARAAARGQTAGLSGSDRLRMFAWGKWLETGEAPRTAFEAMRAALIRNGYYFDGHTPTIVWADAYATPHLSYDSNVNGGMTQHSFTSGRLLFEVDPAYRAIPDIVLEVEGGAEARLAWENGHTFEAVAAGGFGWAPATDLTLSHSSVQVCSRNNVTHWIFLDGCYLHARSVRDLGAASSDQTSMRLSTLFQTTAAAHEIGGALAKVRTHDYDQTTYGLSVESVWDQAVTDVSATFGEPVKGQTVLDRRVAVDVRWRLRGHAMGVGLWNATARGGTFLGVDQIDSTTGLLLSWQANSGTTIEAGYSRTTSTAKIYNNDGVTLQLQFEDFGR